jgi:hypothetical protein
MDTISRRHLLPYIALPTFFLRACSPVSSPTNPVDGSSAETTTSRILSRREMAVASTSKTIDNFDPPEITLYRHDIPEHRLILFSGFAVTFVVPQGYINVQCNITTFNWFTLTNAGETIHVNLLNSANKVINNVKYAQRWEFPNCNNLHCVQKVVTYPNIDASLYNDTAGFQLVWKHDSLWMHCCEEGDQPKCTFHPPTTCLPPHQR